MSYNSRNFYSLTQREIFNKEAGPNCRSLATNRDEFFDMIGSCVKVASWEKEIQRIEYIAFSRPILANDGGVSRMEF